MAGAEECDGSGPSEEGAEGFPEDDAEVEGEMDGGGADGSPCGVAVGEGGVHGEDVADELVVGVEVGDVGEGDEGEEERDRGEEEDLCPAGSGLSGGWEHGGILAGGEEIGSRVARMPTHAVRPHEWGTRGMGWFLCMGEPTRYRWQSIPIS